MTRFYQVRYTVGDKTVAHEHETEKGAKADAKHLSKSLGNAMIGEVETTEDGLQNVLRVWEATGGEIGKPIKREGPPTPVEVIKTIEDTRLAEGKVEKKPKAPKLTEAEKLAKKRADAEALIAAIDAGTYVAPVRGRKAKTTGPKEPKDEMARVKKIVEDLNCSEKAAQLLVAAQLNATGRRARVDVVIFDNGPILASSVVEKLNASGKEDRPVDLNDVMEAVNHTNFKFSKMDVPWRIIIRDVENDKRLSLAAVKIEYETPDEEAVAAE